MLERLLDLLVCPACLPEEHPLSATVATAEGEDILEGALRCPSCGGRYPIRQGLAELVPLGAFVPEAQARYDQWRVVAAYLWSHFADLWGDPHSTGAYARWAEHLTGPGQGNGPGDGSGSGLGAKLETHHDTYLEAVTGAGHGPAAGPDGKPGLDAGCAVGRFTFELAARCGFAVGVDLSRPFVSTARTLARQGRLAFEAPREGLLRTPFTVELPARLRENPVEFITADAQALPFRADSFAQVASLNIVDKLPRPLDHLRQCQRVCAQPGLLLVSDPFSWSEEIAPPEAWLGGTEALGAALDNIPRLLGQLPGWSAQAGEPVWWTIRDHANRFERIASQVILARRTP